MLSSPPPSSSYAPPTSAGLSSKQSKRQSLNGPKPLHLVDGSPVTGSRPASPFSTPNSPWSAGPTSFRDPENEKGKVRNPRRQSSISYNTSTTRTSSENKESARSSVQELKRSASTSGRPSSWNGSGRQEKDGSFASTKSKRETFTGVIGNSSEEKKPPVTLAEKHADLLQFIAQKESKCLDLRTQLASHEAELLQLKKKWERIVERSFSRNHPSASLNPATISTSSSSSTVTSDSSSPQATSATMNTSAIPTTSGIAPSSLYTAASLSYLDSLVTNTGRFLGLSVPPESSTPPSAWKDERTPRSGSFPQSNEPTHSPSLSYSSTTTSSSHSLEGSNDELASNASQKRQRYPKAKRSDHSLRSRPNDILIVTDTGATPLCSPNSEFEAFFGQDRQARTGDPSSSETEDNWGDFQSGSASDTSALSRSNSLDMRRSPFDLRTRKTNKKPPSPGFDTDKVMGLGFAPPQTQPSSSSPSPKETLADKRLKRTSLSLQRDGDKGDDTSLASWMGLSSFNGGKKWDKFSGSIENALAKSPLPIPKRASILLSQLSQVPGLSQLGGMVSPTVEGGSRLPTSSFSLTSGVDKANDDNISTSELALKPSASSVSLLDEDVPPIPSSSSLQPSLVTSRSRTKEKKSEGGDDEWNW